MDILCSYEKNAISTGIGHERRLQKRLEEFIRYAILKMIERYIMYGIRFISYMVISLLVLPE